MSLARFWDQVVLPLHTADPVENRPIVDWWKAATTVNAGGHLMSIATPQPAVTDLAFWAWARRTVTVLLSHLPSVNAPGLNQVAAAVSQVATQLQSTEQVRIDEATARANMSFTQRFGAPLANVIHWFCRVDADARLPEIHKAFALNEKRSRDTANINLSLYTHLLQTSYINPMNLPKVTPWMLDIFRQHELVGNGMELGAGLNPFSVVCSGHHNTKDILLLAKRQATVEAGAMVSLADTLEFKKKDARFPKTYLQASDKLWAFCLLCRVYLGETHVLYVALAESLLIVCPLIQNLECVFASSNKEGLLVAIRAMLAYQSKVQAWLRSARATATTTVVTAPDFSRILEAMDSQTYDSLP